MNALELRAALALAAVYMFRMLGLFMVLPVLAVTATDFVDYSPILVGVAIGAYGLMQALLQIPMGSLSDKLGRKPVILLGLSVFAVGSIVAAQADTLFELVIGRFLQGGGAVASAIMALATDVSREKSRSYVMATIGIAIGFSFYLAVLIGPIITAKFGLAGIFWLTAATALASMPLIVFLVPTPVKTLASIELVPKKASVKNLVTASQIWRLNVNVMLLHLCITLLFVPLPAVLKSIGFALDAHWKIYLPILLTAIVGLGVLMTLARKGREQLAIRLACVLMALGLLVLIALPYGVVPVVLAAVLFFSGFNYLEASFPTIVARLAPAGEKGSAMGLYASFQFMGAFLGGIIAGTILTYMSTIWVFLCGVILSIAMFWVSKGLRPAAKSSRVAYQLSSELDTQKRQLVALQQLEGVLEATMSAKSGVVHLKIDAQFDPNAAGKVLG
ncbi:MFS transporter [Alteromonas sediminis]|uniref:MFS transporter n=1 Tax=Alteromonas sediminis TaxID=2259342 RepID=A0A3N5YKC6_9ALTE|nr:MFS transporter [Alteromonas sediminis]RPJ65341.1 MFS transporter [Alteromonas sediminis]